MCSLLFTKLIDSIAIFSQKSLEYRGFISLFMLNFYFSLFVVD